VKNQIQALVADALARLEREGKLADAGAAPWRIERTRQSSHGDFACNAAMVLAKTARQAPRALAQAILDALAPSEFVRQVEIAGPGFLNFFLAPAALHAVVAAIDAAGPQYGRGEVGAGRRVMLEYVSANPTGPLHVGHGRGAAYGDALARVMSASGYAVHREYYVNDAGRQMDILAISVWLRYLELCGERFDFPPNGYQGDYIYDIASDAHRARGDSLRRSAGEVFLGLPATDGTGQVADPEAHLDALIARARALLGEENYAFVHRLGTDTLTEDIRRDLAEFGVEYDRWFSERSLAESGEMQEAVSELKARGYLYRNEGALWFRSTEFGDEKDRVVVRDNGAPTYFASDIAYHLNKFARGHELVIDIWGADHHGYVPRVAAAIQALGHSPDAFRVLIVQFATLYQHGEKMSMSTRSGEFVTLRELRHEVGNDAARYFYVSRKCEQHLDFDLDLAKSRSNDNPVYYIQYAHARVCSVERQLAERGLQPPPPVAECDLGRLDNEYENALLDRLARFPEIVESAALACEPHQVAYYLQELATELHTYYNACTFLVDDRDLRDARVVLVRAVRQVLANGLYLVGVTAPERM